MAGGTSAWTKLDLTAGSYVAPYFIPASQTGKPHIELGMISPFTVE